MPLNCVDTLLEDVLECSNGDEGVAGNDRTIYFCFASDLNTMPTVPASTATTTLTERVTATGTFGFKPGKCFKKFECTTEMVGVVSELIGSEAAQSWRNSFEGAVKNTAARSIGFVDAIKNGALVVYVPGLEADGRIIGNLKRPARMATGKADTGKKGDDTRQTEFSIQNTGKVAPFWSGVLPLTPAL